LRHAPRIISDYQLNFTASQIRIRITKEFAKHRSVNDPAVIDYLVFKGTAELDELKSLFKTKSHVLAYFVAAPKFSEPSVEEENLRFKKEFEEGTLQDDTVDLMEVQRSLIGVVFEYMPKREY